MNRKRLRSSLSAIIGLGFAALLVGTAALIGSRDLTADLPVKTSTTIVDEQGKAAASVFGPASIRTEAKPPRKPKRNCPAGESQTLWQALPQPFTEVAHASSCQAGDCAGAYMTFRYLWCSDSWPGCGAEYYKWHYSDPNTAWAYDGWRYNGHTTCHPCDSCVEQSCTVGG